MYWSMRVVVISRNANRRQPVVAVGCVLFPQVEWLPQSSDDIELTLTIIPILYITSEYGWLLL